MPHLPKPSHIPKNKPQKITAPFRGCFLHIQGIFINNNSKNKLRKKQLMKGRKADEKLHKNIILHCGTERYDLVYRLRKQ